MAAKDVISPGPSLGNFKSNKRRAVSGKKIVFAPFYFKIVLFKNLSKAVFPETVLDVFNGMKRIRAAVNKLAKPFHFGVKLDFFQIDRPLSFADLSPSKHNEIHFIHFIIFSSFSQELHDRITRQHPAVHILNPSNPAALSISSPNP